VLEKIVRAGWRAKTDKLGERACLLANTSFSTSIQQATFKTRVPTVEARVKSRTRPSYRMPRLEERVWTSFEELTGALRRRVGEGVEMEKPTS
jgi:hypothetical protein